MTRLKDAIACGCIRLCAICDGHEVIDRVVAVYGPADDALRHARFMKTFTKKLAVLVPRADGALTAEQVGALEREGIEAIASPVVRLAMTDDGKAAVTLEDGSERRFDTIYPVLGCRMRSELAITLGARTTEAGDVFVDAHQRTSVPGLYAAGDVVAALNQLSVAVGHAAVAATDLHNALRA